MLVGFGARLYVQTQVRKYLSGNRCLGKRKIPKPPAFLTMHKAWLHFVQWPCWKVNLMFYITGIDPPPQLDAWIHFQWSRKTYIAVFCVHLPWCGMESRAAGLPSLRLFGLFQFSNPYTTVAWLPVLEEWMENQGFVTVSKCYSYTFSLVLSRV